MRYFLPHSDARCTEKAPPGGFGFFLRYVIFERRSGILFRLRRRLTAVVDATNLRAVNRRRLRSQAARYGVPVVAVIFDLPEQTFFDNNARRPDRKVSDEVIAAQIEWMREAVDEVPAEGYAQVVVVGR